MFAKEHENLIIAPGPIFGGYGEGRAVDLKRKGRLCFSWEAEDELAEGIQRPGQVIVRLQRNKALEGFSSRRASEDSRFGAERFR